MVPSRRVHTKRRGVSFDPTRVRQDSPHSLAFRKSWFAKYDQEIQVPGCEGFDKTQQLREMLNDKSR